MSNPVKDDYKEPVFLSDEAKDLNDRFYLILNNLVASFPSAKFKPNSQSINDTTLTNKQEFDNGMAQMLQLQNDYFIYKNEVLSTSDALIKKMQTLDTKINSLDKQNTVLKSQVTELANSTRSAEGMLDDSQLTRNQIFYGNIIMLLFMVTGGYLYYKKVHSVTA